MMYSLLYASFIGALLLVASLTPIKWRIILVSITLFYIMILGVWSIYPQFLDLSRDGGFNRLLINLYSEWGEPLSVTSINPLSGMTSILVGGNPYFLPGEWFSLLVPKSKYSVMASYSIYILEIGLSTFFLAQTLGLNTFFAYWSSILAVLLLAPPFNFMFGLGGWLASAPMYGHALALSNTVYIVFFRLEYYSIYSNRLFILILCYIAIVFMFLLALVAAPFYFAGVLTGTMLVLICILLSSATVDIFITRLTAFLILAAAFIAMKAPQFYAASKAYSTRFARGAPLFQLKWPDLVTWPSNSSWESASEFLCAAGVWCQPFPGWPISISPHWLYALVVAGGILAAIIAPARIGRFGFVFAVMWSSLLLLWIAQSFGIVQLPLSASFVFLMMYSVISVLAICIIALPIQKIVSNNPLPGIGSLLSAVLTLVGTVAASIFILNFFNIEEVSLPKDKSRFRTTALVDVLIKEIALRPGSAFRGSVATILGLPDGTLRAQAGIDRQAPVQLGQFEVFLREAAESGNSHDLIDLWHFRIPTLSEYGQSISPGLAFYATQFLKREADATEAHFLLPRMVNREVLRALGVRFVIVDAPLVGEDIVARGHISAGDLGRLFLYELRDPNIATFSPTTLLPLTDVKQFVEQVKAKPDLMKSTAFLRDPPSGRFQPATRAELIFEKGGMRVRAASSGHSALLLPVQFSNCYSVTPIRGTASIHRANLLHTLVIFEDDIDVRLRWRFSLWRGSDCRAKDASEIAIYGLRP